MTRNKTGHKKMLKIMVFFLSAVTLSAAHNTPPLSFMKAHTAYQAGNFKQALEEYEGISAPSAEIFYNMGNAAYKTGKIGYALLYWRRAERAAGFFDKKEILENIKTLKRKIGSKVPTSFLDSYAYEAKEYGISALKTTPLLFLQLLFLSLWFLLFFFGNYLYRARKRFIMSILFGATALSGSLLIVKYLYEKHVYGVVVEDTELYSGPGKDFSIFTKVVQASEVIIKKESDGFYKIKMGVCSGWIDKKMVQKIEVV